MTLIRRWFNSSPRRRGMMGGPSFTFPQLSVLSSSSTTTSSFHRSLSLQPFTKNSIVTTNETIPTYLIFGANTDVGKTVVSAGLVRSSVSTSSGQSLQSSSSSSLSPPTATTTTTTVHYVKPLQCGRPYDESFVKTQTAPFEDAVQTHTLFCWETPASPHISSRKETLPVSDDEVLQGVHSKLQEILTEEYAAAANRNETSSSSMIWIETAGGVLSPSSASPNNVGPHHARGVDEVEGGGLSQNDSWGWTTQGDLYQSLAQTSVAPVVLVGDGRLGGISATLSALESLEIRGYNVAGLILLEANGYDKDNVTALREYASRFPVSHNTLQSSSSSNSRNHNLLLFANPQSSIMSLPALPPQPEPLTEWYKSEDVSQRLEAFQYHLRESWKDFCNRRD